MSGDTQTTRTAAREMMQHRLDLEQSLTGESIYHVVVEGGYHSEVLSDEEADFLAQLILNSGLDGLEAYAQGEGHDNDRQNIATIIPLVSTSGPAFEEIVDRLDDGNEYPGYYLDWDGDSETYTLYEEGYDGAIE